MRFSSFDFAGSLLKEGQNTGSKRYIGTSSSGVNTLNERNITYDSNGNLLTLDRYGSSSGTTPSESMSYSYSGPKRSTWTYDAHANVTADSQSGLSIAWNALDLPRTITSGTGTSSVSTQRGYLSDGSLAQVSDGTTTRLYLGDMVFSKASNGTVTLESAGWEGGRLLPGSGSDKVLYVVKDHLGSVRVVKDGAGNIRQRFDYYPYGTVSYAWTNSNTTDNSEKRYRFGGKEIAGSSLTDLAGTGVAPGAPYLDFGARLYSPRTATWLSPDPLMEKYYGTCPLVFCAGDPVNLVDNDGKAVHIFGGAVLGGVISGGIALAQGKTGRDFWGAVTGGAVFGAVTAATGGANIYATASTAALRGVFSGALGGVAGSMTEQYISSGTIEVGDTAIGGLSGALTGGLSFGIKYKIDTHTTNVIQTIDDKYASQEVQNAIRKEIKDEFYNAGKTLGTSTKQQLKTAVAERIEVLSKTDKAIVNGASKITDAFQKETFGWGMDKLTYWLYEKGKE